MRKIFFLSVGVLLLNLTLFSSAFAEGEPSLISPAPTSEAVTINESASESEPVTSSSDKTSDDYLAEIDPDSGVVDTAQDVNNSFFAAGSDVTLRGNVAGLAFAAGNKLDLLGSAEYALLAGNTIRVSGSVTSDLFAAGQSITLTEDADVSRDVYLAGQTVTISTNLYGNVFVAAERLVLDGVTIDGNLHASAAQLVVTEKSSIAGTLYRPADLSISGEDNLSADFAVVSPLASSTPSAPRPAFAGKLILFLGRVVLSLALIVLCFKLSTTLSSKITSASVAKGLGFGLLLVLALPLAAAFSMITVVGLPLGLGLLVVWLVFSYLGTSVTSLVLGARLWDFLLPRLSKNKKPHTFRSPATPLALQYLLGGLVLFLLSFVPVVSGLVSVLSLCFGFGHLVLTIFSLRRLPASEKNSKK